MIKEKASHYLPSSMEGGSIMEKMTNGDIGGEGVKIGKFAVTSFLNSPLYDVNSRNQEC